MTHLWMRAEHRATERRTGLTPEGAARLIAAGIAVTVEASENRIIPADAYQSAGCTIAKPHSWPEAPMDAIIFGLKELPDDGTPLPHRHIMFGHAFKQQPGADAFLNRFTAAGGTLLDLEYLTDADGRRLAAFGYWAGFVGAALSLLSFAAQRGGGTCPPAEVHDDAASLLAHVRDAVGGQIPSALIIGAKGRVGTGAADFCTASGLTPTLWDMEETAHGGPFPEVLAHDVFLNCILARPGTPVFVPAEAATSDRALRVIGDIACDPDSAFSPIKVNDAITTWDHPARRVAETPPLDVMAIDNLPSLLPKESSEDFAAQLLPLLLTLDDPDDAVWTRARETFQRHAGPA